MHLDYIGYTGTGHSQYKYCMKEILPKVYEDISAQFIQDVMYNIVQGGRGGSCPRRKKDTVIQGFRVNDNWILT